MAHIVSALPGVFYAAPAPDKPPFVQVGDRVEPGQAVGLIEVMKQFTEVRSEVAGTIASIEVDNAAAIVPGAVLMVVTED